MVLFLLHELLWNGICFENIPRHVGGHKLPIYQCWLENLNWDIFQRGSGHTKFQCGRQFYYKTRGCYPLHVRQILKLIYSLYIITGLVGSSPNANQCRSIPIKNVLLIPWMPLNVDLMPTNADQFLSIDWHWSALIVNEWHWEVYRINARILISFKVIHTYM